VEAKEIACNNAENKYRKSGLFRDIPDEWGCEYSIDTSRIINSLENMERNLEIHPNQKTVAIFGSAGTNHFARALLGKLPNFDHEGIGQRFYVMTPFFTRSQNSV